MKLILITFFLFISTNALAYFCEDPRNPGSSVRIINDRNLPNIGIAYLDSFGNSVIAWNPDVASTMNSSLREFFKYHECAHIQASHYAPHTNYAYSKFKESQADCAALVKMKLDGRLSVRKFHEILEGLMELQPYDTHSHFSGRKRALIIVDDCMSQNNLP